jgi:hypothetical protein
MQLLVAGTQGESQGIAFLLEVVVALLHALSAGSID